MQKNNDNKNIRIVDDDEFSAKVNELIRRDFFPYTINENSAKKKSGSLAQYLENTASSETEDFQQILKNDHKRHSERFWWLKTASEKSPSKKIKAIKGAKCVKGVKNTKMELVEFRAKGKTHYIERSAKNNLMFYPTQIVPNKTVLNAFKSQRELVKENTRFKVPTEIPARRKPQKKEIEEAQKTPSTPGKRSEIAVAGFELVSSTPQVDPVHGNLSPLVTWGKVDSTPIRLYEDENENEDEDDFKKRKQTKMFKISDRPFKENVHRSLIRKMRRNRERSRGNTPLKNSPFSLNSMGKSPMVKNSPFELNSVGRSPSLTPSKLLLGASPANKLNVAAGRSPFLNFDGELRKSYGGTPRGRITPLRKD